MYRFLTTALACLLLADGAAGQVPGLTPGDTVRLTVDGHRTVYQFNELRGDTLVARAGPRTLIIPIRRVELLEVGGRRPAGGLRVVAFSAIGLVVGAALGAGTFLTLDQIFGEDLPECGEADFFQRCDDPDGLRAALIRTAR